MNHKNTRNTRKATAKIFEMVEEGALDRDTVIAACLNYMSEADVEDMAHSNEFFGEADEEDEETTDDDEDADDDEEDEDENS